MCRTNFSQNRINFPVNRTLKRIEENASAEYISDEIARCLKISPGIDETKVNRGKAVLRTLHPKTILKSFTYFKTPEGKSNILQEWSGIAKAVKKIRDTQNKGY